MPTTNKPNERYDPERHGGLDHWQKSAPKLKGNYTVICDIRCHYWVKYRYHWDGHFWRTPSGNITRNVILHLSNSWSGE